MEEDMTFDGDLKVEGNIFGKDGRRHNLTVDGDLKCWDLKCWDLKCLNLNCWNLKCWDLKCLNLNCWDLNCFDLNCWNLNFNAVAIAYHSFKCKSWKARRKNHIIKCLDGEIEIKDEKSFCDKCGQELSK